MDFNRQSQTRYLTDKSTRERSQSLAVIVVGDAMSRGISVEHLVRHCLPKLPIARLEILATLIKRILATKCEKANQWPAQLPQTQQEK